MARYIDADTTIKAIRDKFNIYFEVPCNSDDRRVQEIIGKVKTVIQEQPTADVVPKSEYDSLEKTFNELIQEAKGYLNRIYGIRTDVAMEIFAEIESCFLFGDRIYSIDKATFYELKKKYTEEKK